MSLLEYLASDRCSTCGGRGTVDVPGAPVCDVCPRCHGVGSVRRALVDAPTPSTPCPRRPGCIYFKGHEGKCWTKEDDDGR